MARQDSHNALAAPVLDSPARLLTLVAPYYR